MEDLFKKFIYTGVGWISATTDKLKKSIDDIINEGKLSSEDGKKIFDEFVKNTESKKEEIEEQFNKLIDKLMNSLSFVKSEDLKKLEMRVANLEAVIAKKKEDKKNKKKTTKATKTKSGKTNKGTK